MKTRNIFYSVLLLSAVTVLFTSCSEFAQKVAMKALEGTQGYEKEDTVKWGPVVEQDLDLPAFKAIDAKGVVRIVFTQDTVCSVRVRGNEKCIAEYRFEVKKNELKVEPRDFNGSVQKSTPSVTLYISTPNLSDVEFSGAGKLEMPGTMVLPGSLDVEVSGAGEICIDDLTVESLNIEMNGACKCALAKVTASDDIEIEVNGASDVNANVFCQEFSVELNGAGKAALSGECSKLLCEENGASKVDSSNLKVAAPSPEEE